MEPTQGDQVSHEISPGTERSTSISETLRARRAELAPAQAQAGAQVQAAVEVGGAFVVAPAPATFRQFTEGVLAMGDGSDFKIFQNGVRAVDAGWYDALLNERDLMDAMPSGLTGTYRERLDELKKQLAARGQELNSGHFARFRNRSERRSHQQKSSRAEEYIEAYDTEVAPLESEIIDLEGKVKGTAQQVVDKMRETRPSVNERYNTRTSERAQEILTPEAEERVDHLWIQTTVQQPLSVVAEEYVRRNRVERGGYSEADAEEDRGRVAELGERLESYISEVTHRQPRPYSEVREEEEQDNQRLEELRSEFEEMGLGQEFSDIMGGVTLSYEDGTKGRLNVDVFDTRPSQADQTWIRAVEMYLGPEASEWNVPALREALAQWDALSGHPFRDALTLLGREAQERMPADFSRLPGQMMIDLPNHDRWQALKQYLAEKNIFPREKLEEFEGVLVNKLAGVLIAGGKESWDGTYAAGKLAKLHSPRVLAPLIFYQADAIGASGMNPTGHTNRAVETVMQSQLRITERDAIQELDAPQFVKNALFELKDSSMRHLQQNPYVDAVGTARMIGRNPRIALQEIKQHGEEYRAWVRPVLRGMTRQPDAFSREDYDEVLGLLDGSDGTALQSEVLQTLIGRLPGVDWSGEMTPVSSDLLTAVESIRRIIQRPDFKRDSTNLGFILASAGSLQGLIDLTPEQIQQLEMTSGKTITQMNTVSLEDQIADIKWLKDDIVRQMEFWMRDGNMDGDAQFTILRTFETFRHDYPQATQIAARLFTDRSLAASATDATQAGPFVITSLRNNDNEHVEPLTDFLFRRFVNGDSSARDAIVDTFLNIPSTEEGIREFIHRVSTFDIVTDYTDDEGNHVSETRPNHHAEPLRQLLDAFNHRMMEGTPEQQRAIALLFKDRVYFRGDAHIRDMVLGDFDTATPELKNILYNNLVHMVQSNQRFINMELRTDMSPEQQKNIVYGKETVALAAEKMRPFLNMGTPEQQYWAVYTLNFYNESGQEFRAAVDRLEHSIGDINAYQASEKLAEIKARLAA